MWAFVSSSFSLLVFLISYTQCCVCVYALSFILLFLFLNSLTRRIKCPPALGDVRVRVARERERELGSIRCFFNIISFLQSFWSKAAWKGLYRHFGGKKRVAASLLPQAKTATQTTSGPFAFHHAISSLLFSSLSFQKTLPASSQLPFFPFSRFRKDMMKRKEVLFYIFGGERVARFDAQVGYIFRFRLASTEMISRARYRLCTHKTAAR